MVAVRANTLCTSTIGPMGHRWATKETQNEVADGAGAQKSKTISVVNEATDIEKQSVRNC